MDNQVSPALLAVVGPPAVGKNTVVFSLCDVLGATAFLLRDFASICHTESWISSHVAQPGDPVDGFPDRLVTEILSVAFLHRRFPSSPLTVLLDFPESVEQLAALRRVARVLAAPIMLLELDAPDQVVVTRALNRRTCAECGLAGSTGSCRIAYPAPDNPHCCGRCGGPLLPLPRDTPEVFHSLLRRYRSCIPEIRAAALDLGVLRHTIDAAQDTDTVVRAATAAAVQLVSTAPAVTPRSPCMPSVRSVPTATAG